MLLQKQTDFAAGARGRHFERAAAACYVSQPTPLYGIRRLEEELVGVTYLENEPCGAAEELGWREAVDERLCLLTPNMQNRRIVDGAFAAAGACPRPVVETNSISTLYAHVRAEPLLTRALITTVRDVDLVAVLDRGAAPGG